MSAPRSDSAAARGGDGQAGRVAAVSWALRRAYVVLTWEALWPRLAPLLAVAALFLTASWFGLWAHVADWLRLAGLGAFALATIAAVGVAIGPRLPTRAATLARVERASGLAHRAATALTDRMATNTADAGARSLWLAHRQRHLAALGRLRVGMPAPGLARRDPLALRTLVVLLLAVGYIYAGPERGERIAEAFLGAPPILEPVAVRIDAWATPPTYTGRAPVFLSAETGAPAKVPTLPQGTVVTVLITGGGEGLDVVHADAAGTESSVAPSQKRGTNTAAGRAPAEYRIQPAAAGAILVRRGTETLRSWSFAIRPDNPPTIAFTDTPAKTDAGALALAYRMSDDYGVVSADARIEAADPPAAGARVLVEAPRIKLSLPKARNPEADGRTVRDLTVSPWAGSRVRLWLAARDQADREGTSEATTLVLPARDFADPIARALIEQRQALAMDANQATHVAQALDALTLAPQQLVTATNAYLLVRSAYHRLLDAHDDDALRDVVDQLWTIALGIEGGDIAVAEQALAEAKDAVEQALKEGASEQQLGELNDELRGAMQRYLDALAAEAGQQGQAGNDEAGAQEVQQIPGDSEDQLEQSDPAAAAEQLLSRLQQLESAQAAAKPAPSQQGANRGGQGPDPLTDLMRRQLQLMDDTYKLSKEPGQSPVSRQGVEEFLRYTWGDLSQYERCRYYSDCGPRTEHEIEEALRLFTEQQQSRGSALEGLDEDQQQLQQSLGGLIAQLERDGMHPGEDFDRAQELMGQAADELGRGRPGTALADQEQALAALSKGVQAMSDEDEQPGEQAGGEEEEQQADRDPLGRPLNGPPVDLGVEVSVPDDIDEQQARTILEAIRERLSDPVRPLGEREYLQRLLDVY